MIPNNDANTVTVFILCALLFWAYGDGTISAHNIISGNNYKYIEVPAQKLVGGINDTHRKLKFLGFVNDYVFLMPVENKNVIVSKFASLEPIELNPYHK